jgi:inner membrane protein
MLPDVDLLIGGHRGPSHSLTAALLVGVAVLIVSREKRLALASAVAYASHVLLDWLGSDTSSPIGIMALWPFTRDYYQSQVHLFDSVSRRYWLPEFWTHNFRAVGWELVVLLPLAWIGRVVAGRSR